MPHHETIALKGVVRHVFAHRFTLESGKDVWLADLGPKGAEAFELKSDLEVTLKGERRPSEIKVLEIARAGGESVAIHHKKPHHGPGGHGPHGRGPHGHDGHGPHGRGHHGHGHHAHGRRPRGEGQADAESALALRAAQAAGWTTRGEPRRKPKHFEVLARQGQGPWAELHVDLDGGLYKVKALPADGGKWADEIA
jgi:hypothetical protein